MSRVSVLVLLASLTTAACAQPTPTQTAGAAMPGAEVDRIETEAGTIGVYRVVSGLEHPWGLAFLPDGRLLVTERTGDLRVVGTDASLSEPISGVPEVAAQRQGGLLDVALAPDFETSGHVYLAYSRPGPDRQSATALGRGVWRDDALQDFEVLFTQEPWWANGFHFGARIAFSPDGQHLFLSTGERNLKDPSQDLGNHMGKLLRLNLDGSVPEDNPFVGQEGAQPEIWSYGHRNIQSLAFHPETGDLWEAEFGPRDGDELNLIAPATNYGWPEVSWGDNYSGTPIPDPPTRPEFTDAVRQWSPVISPSGMNFYADDVFPEWTGSLFISSLSKQGLVRLEIDGDEVTHEEMVSLGARIRDVQPGPDGHLYVATDAGNGAVWRLSPIVEE
ncbi:MAG: PQQ-dependent sugar dehydrogenase [Bacteroidota bacterium]